MATEKKSNPVSSSRSHSWPMKQNPHPGRAVRGGYQPTKSESSQPPNKGTNVQPAEK